MSQVTWQCSWHSCSPNTIVPLLPDPGSLEADYLMHWPRRGPRQRMWVTLKLRWPFIWSSSNNELLHWLHKNSSELFSSLIKMFVHFPDPEFWAHFHLIVIVPGISSIICAPRTALLGCHAMPACAAHFSINRIIIAWCSLLSVSVRLRVMILNQL